MRRYPFFLYPLKMISMLHPARSRYLLEMSLVCGMSLVIQTYAQAQEQDEVQLLADNGAVSLAIIVLDQKQARRDIKPALWEKYERQRIGLYHQRHDWEHISERLEELPKHVSNKFSLWAREQRTDALIEQGKGEEARMELRQLIWNGQKHDPQVLSDWRRQIIRSYLGDGLAADAQIAMLRFRQDYTETARQDYMLRARISLLNREYDEASDLLKSHANDPTAKALLLLSQLRGQTLSASKVLQASYRQLREKGIDEETTANLWVVAAEAARTSGNYSSAAVAQEQVMAYREALSLPKAIIDPDSDDLWNAYLGYATSIGNKQQLLIGQDKKWLAYANSIKKKQPVGARSLYAFVMVHGQQETSRNLAAKEFVDLLNTRKQGKRLLKGLFDNSEYFKQRSDIPEPVRFRLVDLALANGDIDRASEIMATIKKPPPGSDQFMWSLRRARILVLGNQPKLGAQSLETLLAANPKLEQPQIDRFMQVVFDLQTAGENETAYGLFTELMARTDDQKLKREMYYWMADSRKAQERYAEAAQLYLKSAMYLDPKAMDPWAQTAHYQAAIVLAKAGLYRDAQTLLENLLKVTDDPQRREALQRELQKLWAMQ